MTTWKPYIFEGRDYLDARKINSWEDLVAQYPGVDIPRSELNKPYARENYQADEWSWPGWEPPPIYWPEWPPQYPNPPGGGNPCEAEDECKYLGIVGPTVVECDAEVWFKNVLVWEGCTLPPGTLMVGWSASCGEIRAVGVGARWRAPECCDGTVCEICASGPGCQACIEVTLDCVSCCEELEITGDATVNPGATWTGTIIGAGKCCTELDLQVTSNSGCTIGGAMDEFCTEVAVGVGADDCGGFTVTITDLTENCSASASFSVRINNTGQGGSWTAGAQCSINPPGCNAPFTGACYNHGVGINGNCIIGLSKWVYHYQPCSTNLEGWMPCGTGCQVEHCPTSCAGATCSGVPYNTRPCPCTGAGYQGWWWDSRVDTWECVCP
jgi:hypothetical protein